MPERYSYFIVLFLVFIFPFLFSFYPKFYFVDKWKSFIKSTFPVALIFILWDVFFTKNKIWWFNDELTSGLSVLNLPIEEILFFFIIPYACLFTFYNLWKIIGADQIRTDITRLFFGLLLLASITVSVVYQTKWYTYTTFLLLSFSLFYFLFIRNENDFLKLFLISFLLIVPGFLLSNGILTGSFFVPEPIVFYNSEHHIGLRILNIPIEDAFYGMLMLLWMSFLFYRLELKNSLVQKRAM